MFKVVVAWQINMDSVIVSLLLVVFNRELKKHLTLVLLRQQRWLKHFQPLL